MALVSFLFRMLLSADDPTWWNRSPAAETLSTSDNRMESIAASTTGLEVLANGASISPKGLPLSLEL